MLTIIITYYNIRYFQQTLESLTAQTDKRFKVLIGNDASPDSPDALINAYKEHLDLEYYSFKDNLGGKDLTLQWKRCLEYVDTEWFIILGDDDMLSPDAIKCFYQSLQQHPQTQVFRYTMQIVDGEGKPQSGIISYKHINSSTEFIAKRARYEVRSSLGEYIFRKEDYLRYGIQSYPKAFYSDNMMVLQYSKFDAVTEISDAQAIIRISDNSFSGNKQNATALVHAGYLFYTTLMQRYAMHFTTQQMSSFAPYVLAGYLSKITPVSATEVARLFMQHLGKKDALNLLLKLMKHKLLPAKHPSSK